MRCLAYWCHRRKCSKAFDDNVVHRIVLLLDNEILETIELFSQQCLTIMRIKLISLVSCSHNRSIDSLIFIFKDPVKQNLVIF
jgi:hypothetical protein